MTREIIKKAARLDNEIGYREINIKDLDRQITLLKESDSSYVTIAKGAERVEGGEDVVSINCANCNREIKEGDDCCMWCGQRVKR